MRQYINKKSELNIYSMKIYSTIKYIKNKINTEKTLKKYRNNDTYIQDSS